MRRPIAGIVLAAGQSSRMGTPKQLLPFRGRTVLETVVDQALRSSLDRVVVVLGHRADDLEGRLSGRPVTVVRNPDYALGQSTSLRAGLRAVQAEAEAALFLLGDQPLISPPLIDLIVDTWRAAPAPVVFPVHQGRRGNPVLFDRSLFPRLISLTGDTGARVLFEEFADHIRQVTVADPAIHFDLDSVEDYRTLLRLTNRPPH